MNKYLAASFFIVAFFSAFWAYSIIDTLLREFSGHPTVIDLLVLFILGLIAGIFITLSVGQYLKKPSGRVEARV
jgi:hypothetical protein